MKIKAFVSKTLTLLAHFLLRYGLALVLIWLGVMKFNHDHVLQVERALIQVNLLGWLLHYFTAHALSILFAWVLILTGCLIALKPVSRRLALVGGTMAFFIFLLGVLLMVGSGYGWATGSGFPNLSVMGQGLLKDIVLLGASAWCLADSL